MGAFALREDLLTGEGKGPPDFAQTTRLPLSEDRRFAVEWGHGRPRVYCLSKGIEMLVLARHKSEEIQIGKNIVITVVRIGKDSVRIGVDAPRDMVVVRRELLKEETPCQQ